MDTVYVLVGKLGMDNLSTHAKKRLAKLNELNDSLANLEKALGEAEKKDQASWEKKVEDARKFLENYENDFQVFLDEEWTDLEAQQKIASDKATAKTVEAEEARVAEEAKGNQPPAPPTPPATPAEKDKSGLGFGTIVLGGIIAVATFGAINYFKNK